MYREFFGLSDKPFQLSPDARFFFPSSEHKRALAFLEYGISKGDGFIVITGDIGTGKTTLVQMLLSDLDPRDTVVANIVTTQLGEDDVLEFVAAQFGLPIGLAGKATQLRELEQFFLARAREGKRVLLIVDEAQNLPPRSVEELRMLSNFNDGGKALLQVFLLGQEEFRNTLLAPGFEQLRQRVIATYHLNPLDASDTRRYIEHRLAHVGWRNDPAISDDAHAAIFSFTQGVPRRINNLCDRLLLYAFLEEQHQVDAVTVNTVAVEIGSEFLRAEPDAHEKLASSPEVSVEAPAQPLESMARMMFDRANVQQRLASLERAVDALGSNLHEELTALRVLLQQISRELREARANDSARHKRVS